MKGIAIAALMLGLCATGAGGAAAEISNGVVRIGVLTDLSGPFSAWAGRGSVVAAQMAVDDFLKQRGPRPYRVEVLSHDFQLKPDIASAVTRQWIDEGVDAIVDVPQSGAALAINGMARGTATALLFTGAQHDDLTTRECSPNAVQWTFDSSALTRTSVYALARSGRSSWFFVTMNLAGGKSMEDAARAAIATTGGTAVGEVRTPPNTPDFSSFLMQAMNSGAKTVGLIQGGADLVNSLKQAAEFGMAESGQKLVATFAQLTDIKALGLDLGKGLTFTEAFYWDLDDAKRDFARRFSARNDGAYPTSVQAGAYSGVLHYLKAVDAAGTDHGPTVVARMKERPVDDPLLGPGVLRPDGRMVHDMYLVEVKKPAESQGPWDLYKVIQTVPGKDAYRPMSTDCPLVSASR